MADEAQGAARPLVLYDADCGVCTGLVRRMRGGRLGARVEAVAFQRADLSPLSLSVDECAEALHVVDGTRIFRGGAAIARILRASRWPWASAGYVMIVPGLGWLSERLYAVLARNRQRLPGGTPSCGMPPTG